MDAGSSMGRSRGRQDLPADAHVGALGGAAIGAAAGLALGGALGGPIGSVAGACLGLLAGGEAGHEMAAAAARHEWRSDDTPPLRDQGSRTTGETETSTYETERSTHMRTITTLELTNMRERDRPLIINVLDREHFVEAHIPNSENVPVGDEDFLERVEALAVSKTAPVVVYCAGPDCNASPNAARLLEDAGFTRVYDYEGGMRDWIGAGHAVSRGQTELAGRN
jgi:rhodanese-related sulfurtransferase